MIPPWPRCSRCLRWWRACPVAPGLRGWGTWHGAGRWRGGASSTWGPWGWCWRCRHRATAPAGAGRGRVVGRRIFARGAVALVRALSPPGSGPGRRQALARRLYLDTAPVLPGFTVLAALISLVLTRIVVVTALSY